MRYGFPRQARLCGERHFRAVYRGGLRLGAFPLRVAARRRPDGRSRLGLAIGRKIGHAVARNRWKRAIREAFRLNRHRLDNPYDMVVSVSWSARPEHVCQVPKAFIRLVEELNARDGQGGNR